MAKKGKKIRKTRQQDNYSSPTTHKKQLNKSRTSPQICNPGSLQLIIIVSRV